MASERARAIIDLVSRDGFQTIDVLAGQFGVSPQTVRRDVNGLCERGLLRRRHGGVDLPPATENLAYAARQILNNDAKRKVGRLVAAEIPHGASLFFGIGTTPEACAHALAEHQGLRVMTINLNAALAFSRSPSCEVTIAGGRLRGLDNDVVGAEAVAFFGRFIVDHGVYGVGGVDADGTLLDFTEDEVRVRQSLAENCRQRLLVLDHSKFGRGATVRGGHITEASAVFTDKPVPPEIAALLRQARVRLVVAEETAAVPFESAINKRG